MWIQSHQEIGDDPRTKKLARLLNISIVQAVGHLHYLLWWVLNYAKDGDLSKHDIIDIADGAKWEDDPELFISSLIHCGKPGYLYEVDEQLSIQDWNRYIGKFNQTKQQRNERDRASEIRKAYQDGTITKVRQRDHDNCRYCGKIVDWTNRKSIHGGTYDRVDPEGPTSLDNLVVACRGCSSKKTDHLPEEVDMHLISLDDIRSSFNESSNDTSNDSLNDHLTRIDKNRLDKKRNKDLKDMCADPHDHDQIDDDAHHSTQQKEADGDLDTITHNDLYSDDFEAFWMVYPRHLDKKKAFNAWKKRLKEKTLEDHQPVTADTLIQCARHYAMICQVNQTDEQFIKHPSSFLGPTHPFEDYLHTPRAAPSSQDDVFDRASKMMDNMDLKAWGGG